MKPVHGDGWIIGQETKHVSKRHRWEINMLGMEGWMEGKHFREVRGSGVLHKTTTENLLIIVRHLQRLTVQVTGKKKKTKHIYRYIFNQKSPVKHP